jgi:glycosyltransferase involved in cell wall biosynthesis
VTCCLTIGGEPLGGVIVEGFINKTLVISTDTGRSKELIENKKNGLLIKPGSVKEFVSSLKTVHNNPTLSIKLTKNAYKFALNNLSNNRYVKNIEGVYENI